MKILQEIRSVMKPGTVLVAVSKYRSIDDIRYLHELGVEDFGENRVQELVKKAQLLPDARWHLIGRLQTNKAAHAIQYADLIQSLDRVKLAEALQKEAVKQNRIVKTLIQVNISREETKTGFFLEEVLPFLETMDRYPNLRIEGIMCIGPHTEDETAIRDVFHQAYELFVSLKEKISHPQISMRYLSMGMSHDYRIALEEGSNMLRIGSALFDAIQGGSHVQETARD